MIHPKTIIICVLFLSGCASISSIPEEYIRKIKPFDESEILINESKTCIYEQLIRDKFPYYRVHWYSTNEIWFYDFKEVINSTGAGRFYLMEIFLVNFDNPTKIACSVKYFSCLEKRLNKIKKTDKHDNGIINLIQILRNCNNGG
ncbi:hypothetical protein GCM10009118_22760 [Wandonia haliotis]|uniref:Lipoprotein n=1 Tax=Wandonia haliotis TaxID=574963 RepID=A0ABN1MR81_9FLAO